MRIRKPPRVDYRFDRRTAVLVSRVERFRETRYSRPPNESAGSPSSIRPDGSPAKKKPAQHSRTGFSFSEQGIPAPNPLPRRRAAGRKVPPGYPTTALHLQTARGDLPLQPIPVVDDIYHVGSVHCRNTLRRACQHLSSPILIRLMSKPVGVMLIDCLQLVVVTAMAAVNAGPWIETLKPLPVKRPATEPTAA